MELACICMKRPLGDLLAEARRRGWTTLRQVTDATGCGDGCGLCRPYIEQMLRTGRVPSWHDVSQPTPDSTPPR